MAFVRSLGDAVMKSERAKFVISLSLSRATHACHATCGRPKHVITARRAREKEGGWLGMHGSGEERKKSQVFRHKRQERTRERTVCVCVRVSHHPRRTFFFEINMYVSFKRVMERVWPCTRCGLIRDKTSYPTSLHRGKEPKNFSALSSGRGRGRRPRPPWRSSASVVTT